MEDKRFVVKITATGSAGVGSDILRVLESLDFEISNTALQQLHPHEILITIFVRVSMSENFWCDCNSTQICLDNIQIESLIILILTVLVYESMYIDT